MFGYSCVGRIEAGPNLINKFKEINVQRPDMVMFGYSCVGRIEAGPNLINKFKEINVQRPDMVPSGCFHISPLELLSVTFDHNRTFFIHRIVLPRCVACLFF